jgi:hypothetical protein
MSSCWSEPFIIDVLSINFLEYSKERLINEKNIPLKIEPIEKVELSDKFLLEIPGKGFSEKMMIFFEKIKGLLPCSYDEIFKGEDDQIIIFENFVYLLHLLQLGKIKYQKETNFLYL